MRNRIGKVITWNIEDMFYTRNKLGFFLAWTKEAMMEVNKIMRGMEKVSRG